MQEEESKVPITHVHTPKLDNKLNFALEPRPSHLQTKHKAPAIYLSIHPSLSSAIAMGIEEERRHSTCSSPTPTVHTSKATLGANSSK